MACNSRNIFKWGAKSYSYTDKRDAVKFDIYKCGYCNTGFLNPPPGKELLNDIYKLSGHALLNEISLSEILDREYKFPNTTIDAKRINATADKLNVSGNKAALDVGSGYGFYTLELNRMGYRTTSINPGKYENEVFKELCGYYPVVGMFEDVLLSEKYGVVVMSQVLEHIVNPNSIINRISELMSSGGVIACAVPNFQSFNVKLMGINDNSCLWIPEHVNFFTRKGLMELFNKNGFDVVGYNYVTRIPHDVITRNFSLSRPIRFVCESVIKVPIGCLNVAVNAMGLGLYINIYARKI